jgi:hypothetical protein
MLLSVVLPDIGPGPFSVVIDQEGGSKEIDKRPFANIQAGTPVIIGDRIIDIGDIRIDTHDVATWEPRLEWERLGYDKFAEVRHELIKVLMVSGVTGSLITILRNSPYDRIQSHLIQSWSKVTEGLRKLDLSDYSDEIGRIVGLGVGLTPAGDDFLVGVMMAIWFLTPRFMAEKLTRDIASAAVGKTTLLSEAFIKAAGNGEASYPWHRLLEAMAAGNSQQLRTSLLQLIRTGSTSGSDALTGFVLAGDILTNYR